MKDSYYNLVIAIENFHISFLDSLKLEINKLEIKDINNVQAFLMYNIGDKVLSIGDLTNHRYYFGTNVSYNLRKLVENGYLLQQINKHDRRSSEVKRTEKGLELCKMLDDVFEDQAKFLNENGVEEYKLKDISITLSLADNNLRKKR